MVDPDFFTTKKYFAPVTCFLTFNFCAMIGNLFPAWIQWVSSELGIHTIELKTRFLILIYV